MMDDKTHSTKEVIELLKEVRREHDRTFGSQCDFDNWLEDKIIKLESDE